MLWIAKPFIREATQESLLLYFHKKILNITEGLFERFDSRLANLYIQNVNIASVSTFSLTVLIKKHKKRESTLICL